jgi:hypothetical protein
MPVNRDGFDDIRVGDLFKRLSRMAWLAAGFSVTSRSDRFFAVRIGHRRFAAVPAIEPKTIDQDRYQKNHHLKAALEGRREIFLLGN